METTNPNLPPGLEPLGPDDQVESEVVEYPAITNPWSIARQICLQALYEIDSARHPAGEVLNAHLNYHNLSPETARYLRQLVLTVLDNRAKLDEIIQEAAPEWPLDQVAVIDRNILRMAVCEFAVLTHAPLKVAIDEAVQLAKLYGAEGSPRFVNGVLGTLAKQPAALRQMLTARDPGDEPIDLQD